MRRRWRDATQTIPGLREQDAVSMPAGEERTDGDGIGCPGSRLGRYVILYRLGSGGMGTVHLAERADDQYQQMVALKLVARNAFHPGTASRFRSERQILARLNHPNIAQVYGFEDRALIMELLEGTTLRGRLEAGALPAEAPATP